MPTIVIDDALVTDPPADLAVNQLRIRGLVMGPGTPYIVLKPAPVWWGARDLRTADLPLGGAHGIHAGRDRYGGWTMTATLGLNGTATTIRGLMDDLAAAWAVADNADIPIDFNFMGAERTRLGRPRRFTVTPDDTDPGYAVANVQFVATDPYDYGPELTGTTSTSQPGPGFTLPVTLPVTLGAGTSGVVDLVNAGTAPAHWSAVLNGPVTNPKLTNLVTGDVLDWSANGGMTLGSSDYLTFDTRTGNGLFNGVASRAANLTAASRPWLLQPGDNNIKLDSSGTTGSVTFKWRAAFY